ncbi:MAG: hypothetical protein HeimAB125_07020 [Candidatus Heimdallarchaeota archaeon AB_125]|nr:MAG: hypothetical protein HeimAB125_07020 [Candidatus Heimdallarchaeota archaeon AB_125]
MTQETYRIYSRVLKFGQRIGLRRFVETLVFGLTIFAITLVYLYVITFAPMGPTGKYIFFPLGFFFELVLILSYIENHYFIDIFGENTNKLLSVLGIASLTVIILYASIPGFYIEVATGDPLGRVDSISVALIVLFFLLNVIESAYFLFSIPRTDRSDTFGLENQFSLLEKSLETKRLAELNINKSMTKGLNALKRRVSEEGFWGDFNPTFETACVLELFNVLGYNEDTEWIINTEEGKKTVTLGKSIESLKAVVDTAETIDNSYEQFYVLYVLSLFDPTIFDTRIDLVTEFFDSIFEETEWDFINKLNRFTSNLRSRTTPLHIMMSYVGDITGNIKLLDKMANLFSASIDIIVKRGYARFSTSQTGKTPIEMFARMMLALHDIRRAPTRRQQFVQAVIGTQFIEGSWAANIGTTGYVIQSLLPSETADSLPLKKSAIYLAAIQDKEGLWNSSIEETTIALTALNGLKKLSEQAVMI